MNLKARYTVNKSAITSVRELLHHEKRVSFFKRLDIDRIEEGILIGSSGSLTRGFKLEGRNLLFESDAEINDFEERMRRFLNRLPEGIVLHFVVRSQGEDLEAVENYSENTAPWNAFTKRIVQEKVAAAKDSGFVKKEIFLFVVLHSKWRRAKSLFLPDITSAFGKKARRHALSEFEAKIAELNRRAYEVKDAIQELGLRPVDLLETDILQYLYVTLNPTYSSEILPFSKFKQKSNPREFDLSLRSKLLLSNPVVEECFFALDRRYYEGISLSRLPEGSTIRNLGAFEKGLGGDFILSVTIELPDQEKLKGQIRRKGNYHRVSHILRFDKRDADSEKRAEEADLLMEELAESSDKLFYLWFNVIAYAKDPEALEQRSRNVLRAYPTLGGATGIRDHMNHDRIFLSALPSQGDDSPLFLPVRSEALVHLLPVQSEWSGSGKRGLLFKTRGGGALILDLFDPKLQAKHALMVGTTGSGKSFFTNYLILHFLIESTDHDVVVIDLGGSYKKLARVLEGSYLEVEASERYAIRLFPERRVLYPDQDHADALFLQFLKELLMQMIGPKRDWSSNEKMILERTIHATYEHLKESESPLLGDIQVKLKNYSAGDSEDQTKAYQFSKELSLFTEGEYGKVLNRRGVFHTESRLTVFDLRKIAQYPELQEIFLLVIPFTLRRKFENLAVKKLLILDEVWQLLKDAHGSEIVEVYCRTARKLLVAVLSISQNLGDFLDSLISSVMMNNSPVKYILRLKKDHEKLAHFGFNENEIEEAKSLEAKPGFFSETFVKFDQNPAIAKLEPTGLEYWIATTDPEDLDAEDRIRARTPEATDREIYETLSREYPHGIRKGKAI